MVIKVDQSEPKKLFLLLSQCARSKRNVKSLKRGYYTTMGLQFGLKIGKIVKKIKPFGQTPLPWVTEQHPRYPLVFLMPAWLWHDIINQTFVFTELEYYPPTWQAHLQVLQGQKVEKVVYYKKECVLLMWCESHVMRLCMSRFLLGHCLTVQLSSAKAIFSWLHLVAFDHTCWVSKQ